MVLLVRLCRGTDKITAIVLCKLTCQSNAQFSDLRLAKPGVITASMNNNYTVFTLILSQHFQVLFDGTHFGPGKHLTMVIDVSNAIFLTMELPFRKVGFSAGVSLSRHIFLEMWTGM